MMKILKKYRLQTLEDYALSRSMWHNPIHFFACGFGVGSIPFMPGTFGTLMAIPMYLLMVRLPWLGYFVLWLLYSLAMVYCIGKTDSDWGTHDHPATVSDEIVGYLLTMFMVSSSWFHIILGFLLFRLFDILKPGPIGWVDRHMSGGFGVVLDDIAAAVPSWLILLALQHFGF